MTTATAATGRLINWFMPVVDVTERHETLVHARAVATDGTAQRKFLRYWRWAGVGMVLIRWLLLPALRREAERRAAVTL